MGFSNEADGLEGSIVQLFSYQRKLVNIARGSSLGVRNTPYPGLNLSSFRSMFVM